MKRFISLRRQLNIRLADRVEHGIRTTTLRYNWAIWRNRKQADVLRKAYKCAYYLAAGSK